MCIRDRSTDTKPVASTVSIKMLQVYPVKTTDFENLSWQNPSCGNYRGRDVYKRQSRTSLMNWQRKALPFPIKPYPTGREILLNQALPYFTKCVESVSYTHLFIRSLWINCFLQIFLCILKFNMSIGIHRNTDIRVSHNILKHLRIHSRLSHIRTKRMTTHMLSLIHI